MDSPYKRPVTRKCFHLITSCCKCTCKNNLTRWWCLHIASSTTVLSLFVVLAEPLLEDFGYCVMRSRIVRHRTSTWLGTNACIDLRLFQQPSNRSTPGTNDTKYLCMTDIIKCIGNPSRYHVVLKRRWVDPHDFGKHDLSCVTKKITRIHRAWLQPSRCHDR